MIKLNKRKSIIAFSLTALTLFSLAGCSNLADSPSTAFEEESQDDNTQIESTETESKETQQADTTATEQSTTQTDETQEADGDILVVYFSRTGEQYSVGTIDKGNTSIVADMIADAAGADMFEILPQEDYYPYTYDELTEVAKSEQNENARPAYQETTPDLSKYSTVFIGAPVWWGDWPMIMYTFFENNSDALAGKNLIPFSTHEGSGLSGFDTKLEAVCPNSRILEGLAIRGDDCQNNQDGVRDAVDDWMSGLEY